MAAGSGAAKNLAPQCESRRPPCAARYQRLRCLRAVGAGSRATGRGPQPSRCCRSRVGQAVICPHLAPDAGGVSFPSSSVGETHLEGETRSYHLEGQLLRTLHDCSNSPASRFLICPSTHPPANERSNRSDTASNQMQRQGKFPSEEGLRNTRWWLFSLRGSRCARCGPPRAVGNMHTCLRCAIITLSDVQVYSTNR